MGGIRHIGLLHVVIDAAVPVLMFCNERVQNGRRVTLTDAAMDADGRSPAIGESTGRIVASGAGDGAVGREAGIEEQLLPQRSSCGDSRIWRGDDPPGQKRGPADLI